MKTEGKVIVVTGAGNGMGRAIALHLLNKGAKVVAMDINEKGMQETVEMAGSKKENIATLKADITDREMVKGLEEKAVEAFGQVDGIINNAGIIQKFERVNDMDFKDIDRVMDINFNGTLNMTKAFLPYLLTRPEAHIVNVSSMGAFLPVPGQSFYGASKAAVKALTEGLMTELKSTNVHVSEVFPGAVKTNIKQNSGLKDDGENAENSSRKVTTPDEAAACIVKGMEKNKLKIFIGNDSKLMDKLVKLNFPFAMNMMAKMMAGRHGM